MNELVWSNGGIILTGENWSTEREASFISNLSILIPTWISLWVISKFRFYWQHENYTIHSIIHLLYFNRQVATWQYISVFCCKAYFKGQKFFCFNTFSTSVPSRGNTNPFRR